MVVVVVFNLPEFNRILDFFGVRLGALQKISLAGSHEEKRARETKHKEPHEG